MGALGAVAFLRTALPPAERDVLVARHDLVVGTVVHDDDVMRRRLPASAVPDDAAPSAVGRVARITVLAGSPLTLRHLAPPDPGDDHRVIAVAVAPGLHVETGDEVDVHASDDVVSVLVERAVVVRVDQDRSARTDVVALRVRNADARALAPAIAHRDTIVLAAAPPRAPATG